MAVLDKSDGEMALRQHVREQYGQIARKFDPESKSVSCCGPAETVPLDTIAAMYETPDVADLPGEVTGLALGCGDPVTLASLKPGQTVLDLGSGGGIDCFLAARQVGPEGKVIGVDMTADMLDRARANQARLGVQNVEFRLGEIEHLPVPDATVDVIISNCVINLSVDKPQVFREAFRVLKPGGRLAVSDMVTEGPLPDEIKKNLSAWAGCIAGAWDIQDYIEAIKAAGFVDVDHSPIYLDPQMVDDAVVELGLDGQILAYDEQLYKSCYSAKVTARKPA